MSDETDDEVVVGESTSTDARVIRVYDPKGDFNIEIPAGAKVTFGYFNPASPQYERDNGFRTGTDNVARQTALRIYERGEKGNQLACFIGVRGFRDTKVKLTRMSTRMVVEQRMADDGQGTAEWGGSRMKELIASPEPDTYG